MTAIPRAGSHPPGLPGAEEAVPMNTLDVHLSRFFVGVMIIAGIFTCGVAPLLMWFSARKFPRAIDPEGLTLRNGTRLLWSDLSDVKRVTVVSQSGTRITG